MEEWACLVCCVLLLRSASKYTLGVPGAREVHWGALVQGCLHDVPWLHVNMFLDNPYCSSNQTHSSQSVATNCCSPSLLVLLKLWREESSALSHSHRQHLLQNRNNNSNVISFIMLSIIHMQSCFPVLIIK